MRPSKPLLTRMIKEAKQITKSLKVEVTYLHVDREVNDIADWLGNEARSAEGLIALDNRDIVTFPGMNLQEIWSQVGAAAHWQEGPEEVEQCAICREYMGTYRYMVCGGCKASFHVGCLGLITAARGPFYCSMCRQ